MAKTVRQQLADLVSGKKPNVFYKGLSTDTDEHLIGNDVYASAMNIRINNKDGNLGTVQNISQHAIAGSSAFSGAIMEPKYNLKDDKFWAFNGDASGLDLASISINLSIPMADGSTTAVIPFDEASLFGSSITYNSDSDNYSNDEVIQYIFESLSSNPFFTAVCNVTLLFIDDFGSKSLLFMPVDQSIDITQLTLFSTSAAGFMVNGFIQTELYPNSSPIEFKILSLDSFEDGLYAIGYHSSILQGIIKFTKNADGSFSDEQLIIASNFGIETAEANLITAKSEENENFNRIYWTDGVNPIKTVNLSASAEFYGTFDSTDDFNLFAKSPLIPISVASVSDGGSINCGSWSYMYRFKTSDGKASSYSPITNPIPLYKSSKLLNYHLIVGGVLSDNSGKTVTLQVTNTSDVYDTIELIGIQYLDDSGSAAFFKLKEEAIDIGLISITHTGNEDTTVITAAEILAKQNTWDIAQTIVVKDNRLFAANLKNPTSDIISDVNTFRVKSFKHTAGASTFNSNADAAGQYQTYSNTYVNPDLYNDDLYKFESTDTAKYRYAQADANGQKLSFGASSENFHESSTKNGVYVTFKVKQFNLNDISYWYEHDGNEDNTVDGYCIPPFYKAFTSGEDGSFNNYKNPVFANKFVGYMRDEIYRFGIQFYDKKGNQTFTYPIGDVRFPEIESDLRHVSTVSGDYNTSDTDLPNKYILMDSNGKGYILYPEFKIKLSKEIRDNISGFNIVRAERDDNDKRIVCAGMLHQTLSYNQHSDNHGLTNRIGIDKINLFTQRNNDDSSIGSGYKFGVSDMTDIYTVDTPEVAFGKINYTVVGAQNLKICNVFHCKSYDTAEKPTTLSGVIQVSTDSAQDVSWFRDSSDSNTFYAAPFLPATDIDPNLVDLKQNSVFSLYYCDDDVDSPYFKESYAHNHRVLINYGQNVGSDEVVDASLLTTTKDFRNATESYSNSDEYNYINTSGTGIQNNGSKALDCNRTLMLNTKTLTTFSSFDFGATTNFGGISGFSIPTIKNENYFAAKPYVKIIKTLTNTSGQYGGNSDSVFISQRWISTGCGLYGDEVTADIMHLDVFGGDTYLNIFSLNKFNRQVYNSGSNLRNCQGLVFPVESSMNLDMRKGSFFGINSANLQIPDEFSLTPSYNAQNSIKSYPAKDPKIKSIKNLKNIIAASNIKINGTRSDSFSAFDANENFELNGNYGSINNLVVFRDSMYALQNKATSVVSINTRALIQSETGSNIAIQSAVGTGTVIERNDYISTKFGSQNRMNTYATDLGLYWVDGNSATICSVSIKNPNYVFDLLEKTNNTSLFFDIAYCKLGDSPLQPFFNGGVNISFNPYYNEVMFSLSYEKNSTMSYLALAYDEDGEIFTSKRSYNTFVNCVHEGVMYSAGYSHDDVADNVRDGRHNIYYEDVDSSKYTTFYGKIGANPFIEYVCNEEVGSLKTFDKITLQLQENIMLPGGGFSPVGIFTKFVYKTNLDEEVEFLSTVIGKQKAGKYIVPITDNEDSPHYSTKRFKGNYIKVKIEQITNKVDQKFNLFSATTYYRKNII
jgi:hypothetical protein